MPSLDQPASPRPRPLVFAHANSFPAGTYRRLLSAFEAQGYTVFAIDKFGHDEQYPVTDQWPHLVAQLQALVHQVHAQTGQKPYLVGHSLGGILSLMCAARHPEQVRGVVLLDSPVVTGWRAGALRMVKRSPLLRRRFMPSAVSQRRRTAWASRDEASTHFAAKRLFARWHPEVLRDYVEAGLAEAHDEGGVTLSFDRGVETRIYDTLPHGLGRLLRLHPPRCPVAFVGGTRSRELRQAGLSGIRRLPDVRLRMVEGTHLFPMEKPTETVAVVSELLGAMHGG
ncbi:alpha/beta hydrolase [Comamonas serinivorans]|uniref:Alpha/beta hydrolase n=1 Tax=Comamonas serinivorans TaxID=1082851 RepID=A0A1Y0ENT8_9BURK|nr:alpha/beta hydrolase [Comamonas serinivorans]ARU05304.1 alpha/beta hydrolase [Comamonas serinivorans]